MRTAARVVPKRHFVVERLVHQAAAEMGIAQDEIRRRNFIRTFPYQTPVALLTTRATTSLARRGDAGCRCRRLRGAESESRFARQTALELAAALLSQRLAGGDLAGLLRRFAAGAAERDRVAEDARSATAQARFTGLLVVAMPSGAPLFAELLQPGFLAKLLGSPAAAVFLALAAALQLAGFVAIRADLAGGR